MKYLISAMLLCCQAYADPLRVLMIDAGAPKYTKFYGSSVGNDVSLDRDKKKTHEHATAMFKFIMAGNCQNTKCLRPSCSTVIVDWCNFYVDEKSYRHCLDVAIKNKYDIVNMSLEGENFISAEKAKIDAISKDSLVVIAAGNSGKNIRAYPSLFSTTKDGPIIAVSAVDENRQRLPSSNRDNLTVDFLGSSYYYNTSDRYWHLIQGTSVAAALYTNQLIKDMCPSRKNRLKNGQKY